MHNGQTVRVLPRDKASAAAAMPYGAWAVCTLITHGSGALPGFTSSTFVAAALDQVGGKKEEKKNVCSSSGQLQLLEAPSGQQIMTKLPQRLCNQHVEASRRRLLSALDLIRGRGDALAPH